MSASIKKITKPIKYGKGLAPGSVSFIGQALGILSFPILYYLLEPPLDKLPNSIKNKHANDPVYEHRDKIQYPPLHSH